MRICIDSCVFIHGLQQTDPAATRLLEIAGPDLNIVIPRLIVQEVTRNLTTPEQVRRFYRLFSHSGFAYVVDEPVPRYLVEQYVGLGLRAKADAFIGAFCHWLQIKYLVSDNRHFLQELHTSAFKVVEAAEFVSLLEASLL